MLFFESSKLQRAAQGESSSVHIDETPLRLIMRFTSNPAALATVRKKIEEFSIQSGLDTPASEEVGLVVNEALANVIRHAYAGATDKPVQTTVEKHEDGVKIQIRDWGNGINPQNCPRRPHDPLTPGGLGLICMGQLMEQVKFEPQGDGMLLTLTRTRAGHKTDDKS